MNHRNSIMILVLVLSVGISIGHAETTIDLESGLVYNSMNDVGIPGDTGTRFSLTSDFSTDLAPFLRVRVFQTLGERHTISALYAPLEVQSSGISTRAIAFAGAVFPANTDIDGTYKFNSYRLTYRYDFVKTPANEFGMGFTAKIRDAKIALKGGGLSGEKANVGFVPIINFRYLHNFSEQFAVVFEGDALAAPQGRAEDVLLGAIYDINEKVSLKAGYRVLEGGADNDEVYGFALFNYAVLGLSIKL
ncbi:MAG: hypothetical protein CVU48_02255 [Candidatus Cloacimonetes bacterium HGW-Cloacimonetes-1]|nr:MAG: hypothetical protein CVU48_02255 [Candidatus Cloacimonetes bacterium HGW-Cloacimonetes-1]